MPNIDYAALTNEELSTSLLLLAHPFTGADMPDSDRDLLAEAARRLKPTATKGTTMTNLDIAETLATRILDNEGEGRWSFDGSDDYFEDFPGWGVEWSIDMRCTYHGGIEEPSEFFTSGWVTVVDPEGNPFNFEMSGPDGYIDLHIVGWEK